MQGQSDSQDLDLQGSYVTGQRSFENKGYDA